MLDRRAFFKGAFGGVTAAGIVLAGNPRDIELFTDVVGPGQPIMVGPQMASIVAGIGIGEPLFNSRGQMVGVLDEVRRTTGSIDNHGWGDDTVRSYRGTSSIIGRVVMVGSTQIGF